MNFCESVVAFPTTREEALAWKPTIRVRVLAHDVLVVAVTRIEGAWKAYIGAVPGENHDYEWQAIQDYGCTLTQEVACVIFPEFGDIPYVE